MSTNSVELLEPNELQVRARNELLLVQVTSAQTYHQAHLPGAVLVEPAELVCGIAPASGRLPNINQLTTLFARLGYHPDLDIIAYDDEGGGWAGRFLWTLDVIGHRQWAYLNGGLHAWHAAGLALASGELTSAEAPSPTTPQLSIDQTVIAEVNDVLTAIEDDDQVIWDVRSYEEYIGTKRASKHAGRIPGAVNIDWMHLKDPNRDWRLVENLQDLMSAQGITPSRARIITHCQTHHRSGLSYMAARLLGYNNIAAYHGSWSEWGNRDDVPIETGE